MSAKFVGMPKFDLSGTPRKKKPSPFQTELEGYPEASQKSGSGNNIPWGAFHPIQLLIVALIHCMIIISSVCLLSSQQWAIVSNRKKSSMPNTYYEGNFCGQKQTRKVFIWNRKILGFFILIFTFLILVLGSRYLYHKFQQIQLAKQVMVEKSDHEFIQTDYEATHFQEHRD